MPATAAMTNKTVLDRYLALPQGERYEGGDCFCFNCSALGFKLCTFGLMELEKDSGLKPKLLKMFQNLWPTFQFGIMMAVPPTR